MSPLIGRTCVIVDNIMTTSEGIVPAIEQTLRTPGIIMDVTPAASMLSAGQAAMTITETWVLLVLLEGGRLRCVSHRDVIVQ